MATILCEDSLEYMKSLPDKSIDLIVTDPPYGIGIAKNGVVGGGKVNGKVRTFSKVSWDNQIPDPEYFEEILRVSKNQIIWGGNYFLDYLSATRCMLIWWKRDGLPRRTFADCEIAWTSFNRNAMVYNSRWDGFIRDSKEPKVAHPTQKALDVMKWCISEFSEEGDTVFDPFMGSGTTGVAAKELNREFIGIDINQEYVDIAKDRIENLITQEALL